MLLVLFSHGKNYLRAAGLGGVYDDPYIALQNHLDQLIVAMFLFYSGFGMMEQIQKRGLPYVKSIISLRLPKLLLNFDVAVLLFAAANLLMRKSIPLKRFLLSLVAIESLGNSNWYVFIVLVLYLFCYISFIPLYRKAIPERRTVFICLLTFTLLSVALVYIQIILHRPKYWYNTLILFSLGFYYSFFHRAIEDTLALGSILAQISVGGRAAAGCLRFRIPEAMERYRVLYDLGRLFYGSDCSFYDEGIYQQLFSALSWSTCL